MDLETATKGMLDAKAKLRSKAAISSPSMLSENMYRLGQYISVIEDHLADLEEEYEAKEAMILQEEMEAGNSATGATTKVKIRLGETEGQIKRLSRIVASSWKQSNTAMARYNHLEKEMRGQT